MHKTNKNYFIYFLMCLAIFSPLLCRANPIGDVIQERGEIPTYFRYAYSFPFNTPLCNLYGWAEYCGSPYDYNEYTMVMKDFYIPAGLRGLVRPLDTFGGLYLENAAWLKASEDMGFVTWRDLPAWGYRGVGDIREGSGGVIKVYETNPETMSYHITGFPLNRSNLDFLDIIMPYYQQEYDYLINNYELKSLVGLATGPTSDYPTYSGVVPTGPPRQVGGYNNISICNFANSRFFPANSVNSSGDLVISPSSCGVGYATCFDNSTSLSSGTYTLTLNFKDSNGNLIPNAVVGLYPNLAGSLDYVKVRATSGVATINMTGGTVSIDAVADLGNYNFYFYQGTLNITQNTNLDIVFTQPYGKSKIWQQCIAKTNTFNVADIAKEVYFFFGPAYHRNYLPESQARLEKAIYDYVTNKLNDKLLLLTSNNAATLPPELGYRNIPQYTYGAGWGTVALTQDPNWVAHDFYSQENRWFTPEEVFLKQLYLYPAHPVQPMYGAFDFNDIFKEDIYENTFKPFGQILNRMRYVGSYYGRENPKLNVLAVGGNAHTFLWQLSSAINYTFVSQGSEEWNNLDLSQFDTMLWLARDPSQTELTKIENYVANGGGFVLLIELGDIRDGWGDILNNLMGVDYTSASRSLGSIVAPDPSHPILRPYGNNLTGYWPGYTNDDLRTILSPGTVKTIVNSTNNGPLIFENSFGLGRVVMPSISRDFGTRTKSGFTRISTSATDSIGIAQFPSSSDFNLVLNSLFYSAKKEGFLPIMWYDTYQSTQPFNLKIHHSGITGKADSAKLLWLTNVTTNPENFNLHLSASFFNIPTSGWVVLDANSMKVINRGIGNDIYINLEVPPNTWTPLYITGIQPDGFIYSNLFYDGKQGNKYLTRGPYYPTKWFLVDSPNKPQRISTNTLGALSERSSLADLFTNEGWYYDTQNSVLYVNSEIPPNTDTCSGSVSLDLSPNPAVSSSQVTPSVSGSTGCDKKTVYFRKDSCSGNQISSCTLSGGGCTGSTFAAPSTSTTYSACLDMNNNFNLSELGESDSQVLSITPAPVSNSKLYTILMTSPAVLVEMNLPDLTINRRLVLSGNVGHQIESDGTYLYAGTLSNPGKIMKVRIADLTEVGSLTYNTGEGGIERMAIINGSLYANATGAPVIIKIDPVTMTRQATLRLSTGSGGTGFYYYNGYIYALSYDTSISKVILLKIDPITFTEIDKLALDMAGQRSIIALNGSLYIHSNTTPTRIAIVNPDTFTVNQYLNLAGSQAADRITSDGRYLYMNNDAAPGMVTRLDPVTLEYKTISFGSGTRPFDVDIKGGFLYLPLYMTPGQIAKIDLNTFTWVETISLGTGNNSPTQAVIAP